MTCTTLDNLAQYDAVVSVTDHSDYHYRAIVKQSHLGVDTRNATKGINATKIVRYWSFDEKSFTSTRALLYSGQFIAF